MEDYLPGNSTNTVILFKSSEDTAEGNKYYFVVRGMSLNSFGFISKVYVTEEEYNSYDVGTGPRFMIKSMHWPYMDLGEIYKD